MSAGKYNFYVEQGTDFEQTLVVSVPGLTDLTGCTVISQIRSAASASGVATEFDLAVSGSSIVMSLPAAKTVLLTVPSNVSSQKYVYDLLLTKPDGKCLRLIEGTVEVSPRVSR